MRFVTVLRTVFLIVASVTLRSGPAGAAPVGVTRIVDSNTPIPGGTGDFLEFRDLLGSSLPALENGRVAFMGIGADGQSGIYSAFDGSLDVVADTTTLIPGGTGSFLGFGGPSLDGGRVAFAAGGPISQGGIYIGASGSLDVVANETTPVPGDTIDFFGFRLPSLSEGNVAFAGFDTDPRSVGRDSPVATGIYTDVGGALRVVANRRTPIPGSSRSFLGFSNPVLDHGQVVFAAGPGIYRSVDGVLETIADTATPIPGGTGTFRSAWSPVLDDGVAVFLGSGADSQQGVYTSAGGILDVVVDTNTAMPDGLGDFEGFARLLSLDQGAMVFLGGRTGRGGIYYRDAAGSLMEIILSGEPLDGRTTVAFDLGPEALDGDQLLFWALFTDGSQGIYIATIPEPATLALLTLGAALLRRRRSR